MTLDELLNEAQMIEDALDIMPPLTKKFCKLASICRRLIEQRNAEMRYESTTNYEKRVKCIYDQELEKILND